MNELKPSERIKELSRKYLGKSKDDIDLLSFAIIDYLDEAHAQRHAENVCEHEWWPHAQQTGQDICLKCGYKPKEIQTSGEMTETPVITKRPDLIPLDRDELHRILIDYKNGQIMTRTLDIIMERIATKKAEVISVEEIIDILVNNKMISWESSLRKCAEQLHQELVRRTTC